MTINRRQFLKHLASGAAAGTLGLSVTGGGALMYSIAVEPDWIEVTHVELPLSRLDPAFDGYRLLQLSDLHIDNRFTNDTRLRQIAELVMAQQFDAIVLTGDFISLGNRASVEPELYTFLNQLSAPDGKFGVLGNHDYWEDRRMVRRVLENVGVYELRNRVSTIQRGDAELHICGVDCVWEDRQRMDEVLDALPETGAAVLLAHEPDYADTSAETGRFILQMSGHSHGGQVNLPGIGPLLLPELGRKYHTGLYRVGEMWQYTNRGVGVLDKRGTLPAIRFNCRPEISIITLRSGYASVIE